jgi:putative colanic acid biosynthesis UDP-glucose lipid carrier transferase
MERVPLLNDAPVFPPPHLSVLPARTHFYNESRTLWKSPPALQTPLHKRRNALLKRLADLVLSTILILFVFPWFIPLAALLIRLDSRGPVFFRQKRFKRGGALFICIKLRTMQVNPQADTKPAVECDPRITPVGAFLRKTHLDELPQLLNVWYGDMSLIGPRPHMVSDNEAFESVIENYECRHLVKPGITGLAQVLGHTGPAATPEAMQLRVRKDLQYVQQWSILLDMKIIFRTMWVPVSARR